MTTEQLLACITPEEEAQIRVFVAGRHKPRDDRALELLLGIERAAFVEAVKGLHPSYHVIKWIELGLDVLYYKGNAFSISPCLKTRDDVVEYVEGLASDAIDEGVPFAAAMAKTTLAWNAQTDYALFVRLREFKERCVDLLAEYLESFAAGEWDVARPFARTTQEYWERLVDAWYEDWSAGQPDRLLQGRRV